VEHRSGLDLRVGATVTSGAGHPPTDLVTLLGTRPEGYDDLVTEPTAESSDSTSQPPSDASDQGLISDDQLPDDLRPDKNPMAAEPPDDANDAND
jgi:hypothetical protein